MDCLGKVVKIEAQSNQNTSINLGSLSILVKNKTIFPMAIESLNYFYNVHSKGNLGSPQSLNSRHPFISSSLSWKTILFIHRCQSLLEKIQFDRCQSTREKIGPSLSPKISKQRRIKKMIKRE
jgi:hypothetical protein